LKLVAGVLKFKSRIQW